MNSDPPYPPLLRGELKGGSRSSHESFLIAIVTIYAKSDQADIDNKVIESIIEQFEQEN